MNTQFELRCDCCGLMSDLANGDDCPRCGYPVALEKEKHFLAESIAYLQRVAKHGGAFLTVAAMISRYQRRLNILLQPRTQATTTPPVPSIPVEQPGSASTTFPASESYSDHINLTPAVENPIAPFTAAPTRVPIQPPVFQEPVKLQAKPQALVQPLLQVPVGTDMPPAIPPKPARTFSFKAFFADQTINIVSLLGAFLILIGSLSFVVTTPDLALSFFTLLAVHTLFGIMGAVTHRFKSFRIVSVIYTAIFALQVPLVGLAGYRLVSGNLIQFSPSGLVAVAAIYAALVYGALAVYQRFQPFAYLAAVSIMVVDIALAITFHLNFWWWPSTLMLLALASLFCVAPVTKNAPTSQRPSWHILFQPVKVLMYGYVGLSCLCVLAAWALSLIADSNALPIIEIRFSFACTLLLLTCWIGLFAWRSRLNKWLLGEPYLFLACMLACAYACSFSSVGYVVVLTAIAFLYCCVNHFARKHVQRIHALSNHIEFIILALVSVIPFIVDVALPFRMFARAYGFSSLPVVFSFEVIIDLVALLCCSVLTGIVIVSHTGRQKSPSQSVKKWCWLLLLSGFLFDWAYNMVVLLLNANPLWPAFVLTCLLLLTTIYARRFMSAAWADPLDILALIFATQTLLLAIPQGRMVMLALLLTFAVVSYAMALYQRRMSILIVAFTWAFLACFPLLSIGQAQGTISAILLLLCVCLPLAWAVLERSLRSYDNRHVLLGSLWTLPILLISLIYTLEFLLTEVYHPVSLLELWLRVPFALELALLACIWYGAAVIARKKVGLIVALCLACWALFLPTSTVLVLACVAFASILLAVSVSRLAGSDWGAPLYVIGLLAALMLALSSHSYYVLTFTSWALLVFGILLYLVGVAEHTSWLAVGLRWLAVVFVAWSLYDAGLLNQYSWAPIIALLGAAISVGIRMIVPLISAPSSSKNNLWSYAGPLYAISLVAALLMGLDGLLLGITRPFYGAIPVALLAYAVVVYGVLLLEKYSRGLFLTAGFAIWGFFLMVQMPITYCIAVGIMAGLAGVCCGCIIKLDSRQGVLGGPLVDIEWNWPWYLTFLVAACFTGGWNIIGLNKVDGVFIENGLLAFAILSYIIVVVEGMPLWLGWISVGLACWSFIEAAFYTDLLRLFCAVVLCTIAGISTRLVEHIVPSSYQGWWQHRHTDIARPLYGMALIAAVLSGFPFTILNVNAPFYAAVPCALLFYGLLAYGVVLWERRSWLWISAGFMIWGVCLLPQAASCQSVVQLTTQYYAQSWVLPLTMALLIGVMLLSAILGLAIGRLPASSGASLKGLSVTSMLRTKFRWNWSWYLVSLVSFIVACMWCAMISNALPAHFLTIVIALFLVLVLIVMITERLSDLSLLVIGLAIWLIALTGWEVWQMACAYSLLCLFVFAGQWLWKRLPPVLEVVSFAWLARVVSLSGSGIIILWIVSQGGLQGQALPLLAQSGVFAVCITAILLLAGAGSAPITVGYGKLRPYSAGFLLSLAISWELLALGQTDGSWLTLAPASYMIIVSPFLLHGRQQAQLRWVGQSLALCGAMLLLLPTLWSSFDHAQVFPTLLLFIESLLLFLLGTSVRVRFFVLSGAALVIVSAIHLLFLPALGIPTFLALTLSGMVLLAIATGLLVIRTRIASVWSELD